MVYFRDIYSIIVSVYNRRNTKADKFSRGKCAEPGAEHRVIANSLNPGQQGHNTVEIRKAEKKTGKENTHRAHAGRERDSKKRKA